MTELVPTVVLVDPHLIAREGTLALMRSDSSLRVLGDCASGHHAVALCADIMPDVVVVDAQVTDPPMDETITQLRCLACSPGVVVLATSAGEHVRRIAFKSGASACVVRDSGYARLSEAIHAVASGEALIDVFRTQDFIGMRPGPPLRSSLTRREKEVLRLMATGMPTKAIASNLHISPKTVETHRAHVYEKLNMRSVAEIARYAVANGFIDSVEAEPQRG